MFSELDKRGRARQLGIAGSFSESGNSAIQQVVNRMFPEKEYHPKSDICYFTKFSRYRSSEDYKFSVVIRFFIRYSYVFFNQRATLRASSGTIRTQPWD